MQIPLLSGITANAQAEFGQTFPLNLEPVALENGISKGHVRPAAGAAATGTGPGTDRGAVLWNNVCYRVMGTKLVSVAADGTVTTIGDVGGSGPARLDYSFSHLGIRSGTALWLYDGAALAQVTDADLGPVIDAMWIAGYWMTTDGTSVVVTELSDPFAVQPLKYGSAESDPDPVTGLIRLNDEAHVLNRHTIQPFRNAGGNGFPFQAQPGATIPYGCVSPTAKCLYASTFAFVGSARNEGLAVYAAGQGTAQKLSPKALDDALALLGDPASIEMEARSWRGEQRLLIHLPEETWVMCAEASEQIERPVWYRVSSGGTYRIRNAVMAYGKTLVGDSLSSSVGELRDDIDTHFGEAVPWQFDTQLLYNGGKSGLVHSVELVGLPGRGEESTAFLSMTRDGETWSIPRGISTGKPGERRRRLQWRPHTRFSNYLGMRFSGTGGMSGFTRIEADVRPLAA